MGGHLTKGAAASWESNPVGQVRPPPDNHCFLPLQLEFGPLVDSVPVKDFLARVIAATREGRFRNPKRSKKRDPIERNGPTVDKGKRRRTTRGRGPLIYAIDAIVEHIGPLRGL
jgi:hypothetical protein